MDADHWYGVLDDMQSSPRHRGPDGEGCECPVCDVQYACRRVLGDTRQPIDLADADLPLATFILGLSLSCAQMANDDEEERVSASMYDDEDDGTCSCCDENPCVHANEVPDGWGEP